MSTAVVIGCEARGLAGGVDLHREKYGPESHHERCCRKGEGSASELEVGEATLGPKEVEAANPFVPRTGIRSYNGGHPAFVRVRRTAGDHADVLELRST